MRGSGCGNRKGDRRSLSGLHAKGERDNFGDVGIGTKDADGDTKGFT